LFLDLGDTPFNFNGIRAGEDYMPVSHRHITYKENPGSLFFPGINDAKLYGCGYRFDYDEEGQISIPEDAFTAVKEYCQAEALIASNNPKNPLWNDRYTMRTYASRVAIPTATGLVNKNSPGRYRAQLFMS